MNWCWLIIFLLSIKIIMTSVLHACAAGSYKWRRTSSYVKLTSLSVGKNDKQIDRQRQMQFNVITYKGISNFTIHVQEVCLKHKNCNGTICNIFFACLLIVVNIDVDYILLKHWPLKLMLTPYVSFNFSIDINRENA